VDAVGLQGGVLSVSGATQSTRLEAEVRGPRGTGPLVALRVVDGRFAGQVPLTTTAFGREVRLPLGRYHLRLTGTGGAAAGRWSAALLDDPPELVDARQRVTLDEAGSGLALHVRPPLRVAERGAFAQQTLRSRARSAQREPSYDSLVLLETFGGRSVGDNPGAIGRELLARDLGLDLAWVVDDPAVVVPPGTRAVHRRTAAWYDALAHARAYVANASAPYWFAKKPWQVHLQTWHGTPLKRIGEDRGPGDLGTWRHRRRMAGQAAGWDAMLLPNPFCADVFRSAFRFSGAFWETGYPRNDVLLTDDGTLREQVRAGLGIEAGERVVLYAPTWRTSGGEQQSKPLFLDVEVLTRALPDVVVLLRGHYSGTGEPELFGERRRVRDVTRYPDIAELYLAADALVTDYSSVMFDFALTDRPIVLLAPDLEDYRDLERGFYLDIEREAPGPLVRTTEAVLEVLSGADRDQARRAAFRERFCAWEDGRSAARTVDRLLGLW
jgi:CDP-glycerol glycerophosphotransferase